MVKRKSLWFILVGMLVMAGQFLVGEEVQYFLHIPGIAGDVQAPGFEGWIQCTAVQYRVPGIPPAHALLKETPGKRRGMLTAAEVEKPYASFSGLLDKMDPGLSTAYKDKRRFPQWELALCSPAGEAYMAFIFKNVVISSLNQRDLKYYLTFKYETVIWNYTGTGVKSQK